MRACVRTHVHYGGEHMGRQLRVDVSPAQFKPGLHIAQCTGTYLALNLRSPRDFRVVFWSNTLILGSLFLKSYQLIELQRVPFG